MAARTSCRPGIASVDRLLGGGLETDCVTEIYGEGGSGKTLFCLEVAVRVARSGPLGVLHRHRGSERRPAPRGSRGRTSTGS